MASTRLASKAGKNPAKHSTAAPIPNTGKYVPDTSSPATRSVCPLKLRLYHGLEVLAPLATSMVHAKRWTRFPNVDIARCVKIMNDANYRGYYAVEYEEKDDGVQGSLKIMEEVLAAPD